VQVIIQIMAGPSVGRKIRVHTDRISKCGRALEADVGFPHDLTMEEMHFEFRVDGGILYLRDLGSATGTFINDKKVESPVPVHHEDEIVAGRTTLKVHIDATARSSAPGVVSGVPLPTEAKPLTAMKLCKPLDLEKASRAVMDDVMLPLEYVETLEKHGHFPDAVKVLAFSMEPRRAAWWGYLTVNEHAQTHLGPDDLIAFNAVYDWICDPSDLHRRSAMDTAQAAQFDGPGSWLGAAVFWSGESIAPVNFAAVKPDPTLVAQGIMVSLVLTSSVIKPPKPAEWYKGILEKGKAMATAEKVEWPQKKAVGKSA